MFFPRSLYVSARSPSNALLPCFFGGEGSPTKIDYRKKGTLILTALLEDLVRKARNEPFICLLPGEMRATRCPAVESLQNPQGSIQLWMVANTRLWVKPMVPRCNTHFSLFQWGLGCSPGVRDFDPCPHEAPSGTPFFVVT